MASDVGVVTRRLVLTGVASVTWMAALSAWAYGRVPADAAIPIHWNAAGEVDGYAGRLFALGLPVLVGACLLAGLLLLPDIEPRRANLRRSAGAYRAIATALFAFMLAFHGFLVSAALGGGLDPTRVLPIAIGALLIVVGNWLPKVRSNWFLGIRTPWTLSSESTWRRTHRVGGWAFVIGGLTMIAVGALAPASMSVGAVAVGAAVLSLGVAVYSYVVWRSAPDRNGRRAAG
jgi:uncharacterized membrane protein